MKNLKKYKIYFINLFLVLLIFFLVCILLNIHPFGKYSLAISDGIYQFKPMIYDLLIKIKLGILQPYSFNNGLGNPTYFNFLYYSQSPINLIGLLFNNPENMYSAIVITKLAITSLTMTKYASSKTNNMSAIIIATLSYCFCGWFIIYYYYLSFMDIFMIFPLYQYGLEKLLKENKRGVYIFSLSYMIFTNFYLCFSVCIYTILYFIIVRILYNQDSAKDKLNSFINLCKATIIVALFVFFWLYMILDSYFRMNLVFYKNTIIDYYMSIPKLLGSIFYGEQEFLPLYYGEMNPNICCNTLILISLFFYFFNKRINLRERIYALIATLIIVNIFCVSKLDFMMNLFHEIRGLPFRYSFIVCFLEIVIFLRNVESIKQNDNNYLSLFISILLIISIILISYSMLYEESLILLITFGLSFIILLILKIPINFKKVLMVILVIIESFTVLFNYGLSYGVLKESHLSSYKKEDETFRYSKYYRKYQDDYLDNYNYNLYDNTKTIEVYTSLTYNNVIYDLSKLGYVNYVNTTLYADDNNLLGNMLLNIKGDYYLEKIYSVNKSLKNIKLEEDNIVSNQNKIAKSLAGVDNIFITRKQIVNPFHTSTSLQKSTGFLDILDEQQKRHNISHNSILYTNNISDYNTEVTRYYFDKNKVQEIYDVIKQNQIHYTSYKDSKIEGKIKVDKEQIIFTSIPYDTNWIIKIDGKKIKPIKIFDSLIGIETTPGNHIISMEYKTHFIIPLLISIISIIIYLIKYLKNRKEQII